MNVDQELISTVGQLVFAGIAMIAPPWAAALWNKSQSYKIVQDALLWAARSALAKLNNPDNRLVLTEADAVQQASDEVLLAAPKAVKKIFGNNTDALNAALSRRIASLRWGGDQ